MRFWGFDGERASFLYAYALQSIPMPVLPTIPSFKIAQAEAAVFGSGRSARSQANPVVPHVRGKVGRKSNFTSAITATIRPDLTRRG